MIGSSAAWNTTDRAPLRPNPQAKTSAGPSCVPTQLCMSGTFCLYAYSLYLLTKRFYSHLLRFVFTEKAFFPSYPLLILASLGGQRAPRSNHAYNQDLP